MQNVLPSTGPLVITSGSNGYSLLHLDTFRFHARYNSLKLLQRLVKKKKKVKCINKPNDHTEMVLLPLLLVLLLLLIMMIITMIMVVN